MNKAIEKDIEKELASIQCIAAGIDAANAGSIVPVGQMFNPLREFASPTNPRSPAFSEPAAFGLADVISKISQTNPLLAEQVFRMLGEMVQKVQDIPELGDVGRYPNTREVQFYGCPLNLVYTVDEDGAVTVVAVFYTGKTLS